MFFFLKFFFLTHKISYTRESKNTYSIVVILGEIFLRVPISCTNQKAWHAMVLESKIKSIYFNEQKDI